MSRRPVTPPIRPQLAFVANEAARALTRSGGCALEWTDEHRRALAVVVLLKGCTLEQAEAALAIASAEGLDLVQAPVAQLSAAACTRVEQHHREQQRSTLRLIPGGRS